MGLSLFGLIGLSLIALGVLTLLFPGLERLINFPGNARIKAFGTMGIGIVFVLIDLFYLEGI